MSARVLVVDDSATVRRIVCSILSEAGYSVAGSADGADALERVQRERFDLVLVDFVMPRLNGFQFAQAVRSVASLRALPLVLMSARADAIAERFMAATGSSAWLSKPFSPSALLSTVREALSQAEPAGTEGLDDRSRSPAERSAVQPVPLVWRRAANAARAQVEPSLAVARTLLPALQSMGLPVEVDALARALAVQLVGRAPGELVSALEELAGPRAGLEGRLEQVPLGEVFQLLALQGQSGVLRIDRGGVSARSVSLALRKGRLDGCAGGVLDEDFRLGRFLVSLGASRDVVERAAASPRAAGELLGERLQSAGEVTAEQLYRALEQQCRELVYECLSWTEGRFRFDVAASLVSAQRGRLGLAADGVVMEGMRRLDEWRQMRFVIPSDALVLVRGEAEGEPVDEEARAVLVEVDGVRAVRELGDALAMSRFDLCKVLCRLLSAGVLEVAA